MLAAILTNLSTEQQLNPPSGGGASVDAVTPRKRFKSRRIVHAVGVVSARAEFLRPINVSASLTSDPGEVSASFRAEDELLSVLFLI